MDRIRIGNNIGVVWHIFVADDLGESFVLEDKKDSLKVFLRSPYNITEITQFGVNGDTINFSFPGNEQKYLGVYAVVLKDTSYGEKTLCEDFAFELVKHLGNELSDTEENYTKKILSLNSSILVSKQGDSAYETWLRMGNKGSEADFFNWLKGGTLVNYSFQSPLVATLLPDGVNYLVSLNKEAISGLYITDGSITEDKLSPELQEFIYNAVSKERLQELFNDTVIDEGRFKKVTTESLNLNGHNFDSFADQNTDPKSNSAIVTPSYLKNYGFGSYISRIDDDTAHGLITFQKGFVLGANLFNQAITAENWQNGTADNQVMTAAAVRKLMFDNIAQLSNQYIRKDIEDYAKEIITFKKGLIAEDQSYFYAGMYVAGLATFKDILSSTEFVSGWSPIGKGWKLWIEEYENIAGAIDTKAKMELDELTVRGTFRVFEFVINQLRGENDNYVFAAMMKVDHFETPNVIWLDTNDGETYNPFRTDDILRCQQFRGNTVKQYTLVVDEAVTGSLDDGEQRQDYITLKKFEGDTADIQKGDILVRLDNLTDPDRKGIVSVDSIGDGAPSISVSYGAFTDPKSSLKTRLGKLDGIVDPTFGNLSGYGLYGNKVYLTGEFCLVTGEDIRTQFQIQENLLASSQSKTTYDITDSDMLLRNCSFAESLDNWQPDDDNENDGLFASDGVLLMHDLAPLSVISKATEIICEDGKNFLRILNSGITQTISTFEDRIPEDYKTIVYLKYESDVTDEEGNVIHAKDELILNEDGTPATKEVTIRNTFYIQFRYLCRRGTQNTDGSYNSTSNLKFGFNNGSVYEVTGDEGDIINIPPTQEGETTGEIPLVSLSPRVKDGVWNEIKVKGYYDSESDFRIECQGEVLIDSLVVTWHDLDDYKTVVTTELRQKDGIIGLYGKNISRQGKSIVEIGNEVDANKKQWEAWVTGTYEEQMKTIDNRITINENGIAAWAKVTESNSTKISNLQITANKIAQRVSTIEGDYVTSSQLTTTSNSILAQVEESYGGLPTRVTTLEQTSSSITARVENIEGDTSVLKLTANSLTSRVAHLGNQNLFPTTDGTGWRNRNSSLDDYLLTPTDNQSVVTDYYYAFSKLVWLRKGTTYCISAWCANSISSMYCYFNSISADLTWKVIKLGAKGNGSQCFEAFVFKRASSRPDTPSGGTYDNPVPDGWSSTIPDGTDQLYMSWNVFYSDGTSLSWYSPDTLSSGIYKEVIFSSEEDVAQPVSHPNTNSQWTDTADSTTRWIAISKWAQSDGWYYTHNQMRINAPDALTDTDGNYIYEDFDGNSCRQYFVPFIPSQTGYYSIGFYRPYTNWAIYQPKLEENVYPTRFDTTIESSIQQTAELIRITAKDVAIEAIDTATIKASQINLEGLVTANSNFKILEDGSMEAVNAKLSGQITATSGTIGGYTINSDELSCTTSLGTLSISSNGLSASKGDYYVRIGIWEYKDLINGGTKVIPNVSVGGKNSLGGLVDVFQATGDGVFVSTDRVIMNALPTSSTGLYVGQLWRDGNTLKIK